MDDIWIYASVRNEEAMMPFFLRHYMDWVDHVVIQDCGSSDRTREIVKDFGAELIETEPWGLDEVRRVDEALRFVRDAQSKTRWCGCVDADEFLIGDFDRAFEEADREHIDVLQTIGFTMTCDGLPKDDGRQIYDICDTGFKNGSSKPCVARCGSEFRWGSGKHNLTTPETLIMGSRICLLHYRWMGTEYTKARNKRNYDNSTDKGTAWACSDWYKGEHSTQWSGEVVGKGSSVMNEVARITESENLKPWYGRRIWTQR